MQRLIWVDNAKAITITLVVVGHFSGLDQAAKSFIYSFHLPLFLFVTGWLVSNSKAKLEWPKVVKNLGIYIKCFAFFAILSIILWTVLTKPSYSEMFQTISNNLYGTHGATKAFNHANGAIWYFPFLASSLLISYFFALVNRLLGLVVLFIASFLLSNLEFRLPWSADSAVIGAFFICLGCYAKSLIENVEKTVNRASKFITFIILVSFTCLLSLLNGEANINKLQLGESLAVFYLASLTGIGAIIALSMLIKKNHIFVLVSEGTLMILALHLFFVKSFRSIVFMIGEPYRQLLIILLSLIITICLAYFSKRTLPLFNKFILRK